MNATANSYRNSIPRFHHYRNAVFSPASIHLFLENMKYATVFTLILALSSASFIQSAAMKALHRNAPFCAPSTPRDVFTSSANEDVKFCGTYKLGCSDVQMLSLTSDMMFTGMMHRDPIYLTYTNTLFLDKGCDEAQKLQSIVYNGPVEKANGEVRKVKITFDSVSYTFFNEAAIADYTCTEPLKLNEEYDVTKLDCKDAQGEDPFAEDKQKVGTSVTTDITFNEDSIEIPQENASSIYKRDSDDGCRCYSDEIKKAAKKLMSKLTSQKAVAKSNEDIKYCGSYKGECEVDSGMSSHKTNVIQGMMHQIPVYTTIGQTNFMGEKCEESARMMGMTLSGLMQPVNEVTKKMAVSVDGSTVTFFNEAAIAALTCTEPLKVNEEYDVTKLDCKDTQGEDPFDGVKKMIGKTWEMSMTFAEEYMILDYDWKLGRVSDDGCRCFKTNLRCMA